MSEPDRETVGLGCRTLQEGAKGPHAGADGSGPAGRASGPPDQSSAGRIVTEALPTAAGQRGVTDSPCSISSKPSGHFDTVMMG